MKPIASIEPLIPDFDVFVIDQFGTLHDGRRAYPGALEGLGRLRAAGRRIALLSNSGKRAEPNARRLERLGIGRDCYDLSMTSGEVAWLMLEQGRVVAAAGARTCFLIERGRDDATLDGLGLTLVDDVARADLIVIAGSEGERVSLEAYADMLAAAARHGVPCLCTNPDRTMLTPEGLAFGAGRIAEAYQALGGRVVWIGKPYPDVYATTLGLLGNPPPARAIAIGDSVEHDVAGAHSIGAAACLVRTGIIAGFDEVALAAEYARFGATPEFVVPAFS